MEEEIYFEIARSSDKIRIEPFGWAHPKADNDWDKNWVHSKITIRGGAFSGQFTCDLMTTEFELFKREVKSIYKYLNGTAKFKTLENQIEITIQGDGFGHFKVDCAAMNEPGTGNKLNIELAFDQTYIPDLLRQLDIIVKSFPIQGTEFKISNE